MDIKEVTEVKQRFTSHIANFELLSVSSPLDNEENTEYHALMKQSINTSLDCLEEMLTVKSLDRQGSSQRKDIPEDVPDLEKKILQDPFGFDNAENSFFGSEAQTRLLNKIQEFRSLDLSNYKNICACRDQLLAFIKMLIDIYPGNLVGCPYAYPYLIKSSLSEFNISNIFSAILPKRTLEKGTRKDVASIVANCRGFVFLRSQDIISTKIYYFDVVAGIAQFRELQYVKPNDTHSDLYLKLFPNSLGDEELDTLSQEQLTIIETMTGQSYPIIPRSNPWIMPDIQKKLEAMEICLSNICKPKKIEIDELLNRYNLSDASKKNLAKGLRNAVVNNKIADVKAFCSYMKDKGDLDITDENPNFGRTALHWAGIKGYDTIYQILKNKEARDDIPDKTPAKKTAKEYYAETYKNTAPIATAILTHGLKLSQSENNEAEKKDSSSYDYLSFGNKPN